MIILQIKIKAPISETLLCESLPYRIITDNKK